MLTLLDVVDESAVVLERRREYSTWAKGRVIVPPPRALIFVEAQTCKHRPPTRTWFQEPLFSLRWAT